MARKSLISALLLVGIGACSGQAAADGPDPYAYTPSAPSMLFYDWTGFYVGGQVGVANTAAEWTIPILLDTVEQSTTGFAGGGYIGVQKQIGQIVFGAELNYTWLGAELTSGSAVPGTTHSSEVNNLFTATGKLGYAYMNYLAYFRGGYATADVEYRSTGVVTASSSEREHGWTAGLGIDYAVLPNVSLGVSYDYVKLIVEDRALAPAFVATQISDAGLDIQVVMARLTFKFGPRHEAVPVVVK